MLEAQEHTHWGSRSCRLTAIISNTAALAFSAWHYLSKYCICLIYCRCIQKQRFYYVNMSYCVHSEFIIHSCAFFSCTSQNWHPSWFLQPMLNLSFINIKLLIYNTAHSTSSPDLQYWSILPTKYPNLQHYTILPTKCNEPQMSWFTILHTLQSTALIYITTVLYQQNVAPANEQHNTICLDVPIYNTAYNQLYNSWSTSLHCSTNSNSLKMITGHGCFQPQATQTCQELMSSLLHW